MKEEKELIPWWWCLAYNEADLGDPCGLELLFESENCRYGEEKSSRSQNQSVDSVVTVRQI